MSESEVSSRPPPDQESEPPRPPTSSFDRPTAYALAVARGEIVAGPLVRAACDRHLRDLEQAPARGWRWDPVRRDLALDFFPEILRLNGGEFEGEPFFLEDWEAFIIGSLFGWVDEDGFRRFSSAYLEIAKGNGKSPLAAGIGLYMLCADKEARAEVYAAASKKDQAMVLFRDAVAMNDLSPDLSARLVKSGGAHCWNLAYPLSGSFFRAISSDDGQSGPRPHCALIDEVHEHPNDNVVEMMRAGFKGRRQPLLLMITNSGFDRQTVCWAQHEYAERVVTGIADDDRYFAYVCALDEGDEPFEDEACWIKANPNLGISIGLEYLRGQVKEARGMPSKASRVRRLNFCQWVDAENPWIDRPTWEAIEDKEFEPEAELQGEEACGGLDLSGTRDLTALALFFPKQQAGFVEFWTPEATIGEREERDKVPYRAWVEAGFLRTTPGRAVDYRFVAQRIAELQLAFNVKHIAFDPYRIKYMEAALSELGVEIKLIPHGQGYYRAAESNLWMPRSVELLEKKVAERTIRIKWNPVLSWNSASAVLEADPKDNRIFNKRKSRGKIDGLVAIAEAIGSSEIEGAKDPEYKVFFI